MSDQKMNQFAKPVADVLIAAGWHPGRCMIDLVAAYAKALDRPSGFQIFPCAKAALEEFGGLKVDQSGPGVDHGRNPFTIDPHVAVGEEELFDSWSQMLHTKLYPLGEAGPVAEFLAIDENGRVLLLSFDALLVGQTIEEALDHLIRGITSPPLEVR